MKLHSEKRNLLYRVTEWIGKKLSPQKNKPNHWMVWGPTRAGMTKIDPFKKNPLYPPREAEVEEKHSN